jgi:hypothetical protein
LFIVDLYNFHITSSNPNYIILLLFPTFFRFVTKSDGQYAISTGHVKLDGPSPEIQCYACRPITNFNDITHHHLSVIATHIDLVKKPVCPFFFLT